MEKLSFILSNNPVTIKTEEEKPRYSTKVENSGVSGAGWNLLFTRDKLFGIFRETAQGEEASGNKNLDILKQKSEVMLDLGTLDYKTRRKEEELRSWAHYKIGLAKTLHNYNLIYSKFYRDVMKDVFSMNKASNLAYSSPKELTESVRSVMGSMKSFIGMLQPMARVMHRMNEINMKIMKLGHELGPEGARKVFTELQERIESYPDLPGKITGVGRDSEKPEGELMVGKFYQDWTIDCLRQGLETLKYASGCIDRHTSKLKNLASMSKAAHAIKMRKNHDPRSFSLPSTLALRQESEEKLEEKSLQEIEMGMGQFGDINGLEMDIQDIAGNEALKDPYLLASESLAQSSLGKEILGLDESFQIGSKASV